MSTKTKTKAAQPLAVPEAIGQQPAQHTDIAFAIVPAAISDTTPSRPVKFGPGVGLPDNPPSRAKGSPLRPGDLILGAARIASKVAASPGDSLNGTDMQHAEWWLSRAEEPLTGEQLDTHTGGELSPLAASSSGAPMGSVELRNTVQNADLVNADASRERLELAHAAGALETGLDAAETIRAANSLEKMLAHQMAALHGSTMKMVAQLNACIERMAPDTYRRPSEEQRRERANIQATRLAGAVSRMSGTFQQGLVTVQRLRSGGQQVVTVQHVQVSEGGQAIIAGKLKAGGGRQRKGGRSKSAQ